jgi:hypothetical protein
MGRTEPGLQIAPMQSLHALDLTPEAARPWRHERQPQEEGDT